jgi:hypothetical protein
MKRAANIYVHVHDDAVTNIYVHVHDEAVTNRPLRPTYSRQNFSQNLTCPFDYVHWLSDACPPMTELVS